MLKLYRSPIKDEAHKLEVEGARQAVESDAPCGVLFALAALAVVAVIPFQLLLLQTMGEGQFGRALI